MQQSLGPVGQPLGSLGLSGRPRKGVRDVGPRLPPPATASVSDFATHDSTRTSLAGERPNLVLSGHPDAVRRRQEASKRLRDAKIQGELASREAWFEGPLPDNFLRVRTPEDFMEAIAGDNLVIADFFVPWCLACRRFHPALIKLASNNPECTFMAVNGADHALHEFVANLGIEKLPYFQFYRCGEILSQFAANLSKIGQLRAEIDFYKARAPERGRCVISQP
ncbi:probable thioredoxin-like 1-3, chloroplastic [Coccomyxa sp. Obi]|nr:probable thioredoxin-like 1-3, chloroplastic [Coccomyxa sp. Obi]